MTTGDRTGDVGRIDGPEKTACFRDPLLLLLFALTLTLYLVSMPKTIALEDDSLFILSGYFNGVSHPPGYPLYTLLLNLFSKIPIGEVPARAHASSAFFGALACCALFCIFRHIGLERVLSLLAAILFSASATLWSQAIIAEVYSLNLFLNLGTFLFALRIHLGFAQETGSGPLLPPTDFLLFSLFAGLALANHWPLTLLTLPACLLLIVNPLFAFKNRVLAVLPGLCVCALLYGYLYINNQSSPPINFSGRFEDIGEFIDFLLRSHYASVDFNETAGWQDKALFARDLLIQMASELNLLLPFAMLGIHRLFKSPDLRLLGLALLWGILANSFILLLLVNFDYSSLFSVVFRVYTLVSVSMLCILAGFGIAKRTGRARFRIQQRHMVLLLLTGIGLNLYFSLPQNYRHDYRWGEDYAREIFADTPQSAILFSDGEIELGLLAYYHLVERQRSDIRLYSSSALLLENRLFDYRLEDKKAFIEKFVADNPENAVYAANNYYRADTLSGTVFVDRIGKSVGEPRQSIDSRDIDLILGWSASADTRDPWTRLAVEVLRQRAIAIIAPALKNHENADIRNFASASIEKLVQTPADLLHFLRAMIKNEAKLDTGQYRRQLEAIERTSLDSKQDDSHHVYLSARFEQAQQSSEHIANARRRACQNWPSMKNYYCQDSPN